MSNKRTGRSLPTLVEMVKAAERQGWRVRHGHGHTFIYLPDGYFVTMRDVRRPSRHLNRPTQQLKRLRDAGLEI